MTDIRDETPRPHWAFWLIAILILAWHLPAMAEVLKHLNPNTGIASDPAFQSILDNRPLWATVAFAVFAIAGTIGSLLLLLRKSSAGYLFMLSLAGVLVHMMGLLGMPDVPTPMMAGCVMSLAGAMFFIGYSRYMARRGWLR